MQMCGGPVQVHAVDGTIPAPLQAGHRPGGRSGGATTAPPRIQQQRQLLPLPVGQREPLVGNLAEPLPLGFRAVIRRGRTIPAWQLRAGRGHRVPARSESSVNSSRTSRP